MWGRNEDSNPICLLLRYGMWSDECYMGCSALSLGPLANARGESPVHYGSQVTGNALHECTKFGGCVLDTGLAAYFRHGETGGSSVETGHICTDQHSHITCRRGFGVEGLGASS